MSFGEKSGEERGRMVGLMHKAPCIFMLLYGDWFTDLDIMLMFWNSSWYIYIEPEQKKRYFPKG